MGMEFMVLVRHFGHFCRILALEDRFCAVLSSKTATNRPQQ